MKDGGKMKIAEESFTRDAGRIWNLTPQLIKEAKSMEMAEDEIIKHYNTIPI